MKLFSEALTSVVSKYVGMPMTHETFNQMKQDLMANGISEETSQYIVEQIHNQEVDSRDGNVALLETEEPLMSLFEYLHAPHGGAGDTVRWIS